MPKRDHVVPTQDTTSALDSLDLASLTGVCLGQPKLALRETVSCRGLARFPTPCIPRLRTPA